MKADTGSSQPQPSELASTLPQATLTPSTLYSNPSDHSSASSIPRNGATSLFAHASRFQMGNLQYFDAPNAGSITVTSGGNTHSESGASSSSMSAKPGSKESFQPHYGFAGWELLLRNTAPSALYNSDARYDPPKCDEDTRVEVLDEIMGWIEDRESPQRLLCMTGAAGAGKSALQQTTAERCARKKTLGAAWFFSVDDYTRNTVKPVIATIAYQLGRTNNSLKQLIANAVEDDPVIFHRSLQAQMVTLIVNPFEQLKGMGFDLSSLPHAVLIDGLDECKEEERQAELLTAIKQCLLTGTLPIRIFIASRPEWAIRTTLEPGGDLHEVAYHIQLSDKYDATDDIRRYLRRNFLDIGRRHGNPKWYSQADIETLAQAASGQFIFASTVVKYLSQRRGSPAERLKIVLTRTPHKGQHARPFEMLDILYTNILSSAKEAYEDVDTNSGRDFLLLFRSYHAFCTSGYAPVRSRFSLDHMTALLNLESRAWKVVISDLRSLVALAKDPRGDLFLRLYHKSFSDFLTQETRAKNLFVPTSTVCAHLAKCCLQQIIQCPLKLDSPILVSQELKHLPPPKSGLGCAVHILPYLLNTAGLKRAIIDELAEFTQHGGWQKLDKLLPLPYQLRSLFPFWIDTFKDAIIAEPIMVCISRASNSRPIILHTYSLFVQDQNHEVAAALGKWYQKWNGDAEEWEEQRSNTSSTSIMTKIAIALD
ncbi:hypothetical protein H1R20_g7988, partial [Candolleomyces eurysporus]